MNEFFRKFSNTVSQLLGTPIAFIIALLILVIWAISGPIFHYSDTWQLIINTGTTIITFLMVFLIQNTQNRDARAIHLKLDELIHGNKNARNKLIGLEDMSDEELEKFTEDVKHITENRKTKKK